jgi:hypothetical protein
MTWNRDDIFAAAAVEIQAVVFVVVVVVVEVEVVEIVGVAVKLAEPGWWLWEIFATPSNSRVFVLSENELEPK